jgi:hypothetical protein
MRVKSFSLICIFIDVSAIIGFSELMKICQIHYVRKKIKKLKKLYFKVK